MLTKIHSEQFDILNEQNMFLHLDFKYEAGNFVRVQLSEITNHIIRSYFIDPANGSVIEIPAFLEYKILDSITIE